MAMLFATVYRWRDDAHTREAATSIMDHYAQLGGDPEGAVHYVFADGTGGILITEPDDLARAYQTFLHFNEYLDLDLTDLKPVMLVEDALPHITDYLGG
jgi:hypothetical protein